MDPCEDLWINTLQYGSTKFLLTIIPVGMEEARMGVRL